MMSKDFFLKRYWKMLTTPAGKISMGVILAFGFVAGIIFWGGFNTGMEKTNTEEFCISCHEMEDNVFEEYKATIHYNNRSGVRAVCSDCHVPKEWTPKLVRKIQASKELWGKMTGKIDTHEKFVAHRREMAEREWARMKANDSQECRNCHNFDYMDFSEQSARAMESHTKAFLGTDKMLPTGETCIDCHKGIAHELPNMHGIEGW
ncbi:MULTISPECIES: NapC/NirT family cytochrome c [Endozoicomonas]|uniref:Cytochrome c-type protein n=2 Tax=Endozoicomonas elysicola TaxID=305900 RepID=A0A081KBE0_9GAMM|nr:MULTISPECIES: NapC/NirT family cytochrome c [Endozoicomonas]KEI71466.1 cytochrome C [Endozoicomonas elysicola]